METNVDNQTEVVKKAINEVVANADDLSSSAALTAYHLLLQHGLIDAICERVIADLNTDALRARIIELETQIRPELDAEIRELQAQNEQKDLLIDGLKEDNHNLKTSIDELVQRGRKKE